MFRRFAFCNPGRLPSRHLQVVELSLSRLAASRMIIIIISVRMMVMMTMMIKP